MACVEVHLLAESLFVVADVDFKSGESARQTLCRDCAQRTLDVTRDINEAIR